MTNDATDPVHTWFGHTYSNYLVLPRTLMQSMPADWQKRMVACLTEMDDAFDHIEKAEAYVVTAAVESTYSDLSQDDMELLGVTVGDGDGNEVYYDRDGTEHGPHDRVLAPRRGGDPVPGYNRGRTFIQPRLSGGAR